jgi:glycosyltransferase involved in cell wall biosynthesis
MRLEDITPLILTRDEEANLARTLAQLTWAREVLIVDSFSTDQTLAIAASFPNVRILQRTFDSLAEQSNYGLANITTPWAMLLDADYFVPSETADELRGLAPAPEVRAYRGSFRYAVNGKPLRASLYPPRVVLLHREHAKVWQDGHAHRVHVDGDIDELSTRITHDDRKPFSRFVDRQRKYMREEAVKLRTADPRTLSLPHRVRKLIVIAPFAVVLHALFWKGLILDGTPGLRYAWERFVAELMLSRELLRSRKTR